MKNKKNKKIMNTFDVSNALDTLNLNEMATIYDWYFECPTQMVVLEALNDAINDKKITPEIKDIVMEYIKTTHESCLDELATFNTKEWQEKWKSEIKKNFTKSED